MVCGTDDSTRDRVFDIFLPIAPSRIVLCLNLVSYQTDTEVLFLKEREIDSELQRTNDTYTDTESFASGHVRPSREAITSFCSPSQRG
jgi:hypothetical protein